MKIKKGDLVKVIAGAADRKGKVGRVMEVDPKTQRVKVEGTVVIKRHIKPQKTPKHPEGGIIEDMGTIHVSNVMLMSEEQGRPVRVGFKFDESGKKVRVAKGLKIKPEVIK